MVFGRDHEPARVAGERFGREPTQRREPAYGEVADRRVEIVDQKAQMVETRGQVALHRGAWLGTLDQLDVDAGSSVYERDANLLACDLELTTALDEPEGGEGAQTGVEVADGAAGVMEDERDTAQCRRSRMPHDTIIPTR
jgi:hypothetical protein